MIYFSKTGSFDNPRPGWPNDEDILIKIQIDNSLDLGWKREDILLFTNFDYQYGGVKATVINNSEFSQKEQDLMKLVPVSSKFVFIAKLFEKGIIKSNNKDEIYWLHDLDSFQLEPITDSELELDKYDIGAVNYPIPDTSYTINYHISTFFFKPSARDIFLKSTELMLKENNDSFDDERAINTLCESNPDVLKRIKSLDWRYTIKRFGFEHYLDAVKPIKIVHFRPSWVSRDLSSFDKFTGTNDLHVSILPERLIKIFADHGIKPGNKNKL